MGFTSSHFSSKRSLVADARSGPKVPQPDPHDPRPAQLCVSVAPVACHGPYRHYGDHAARGATSAFAAVTLLRFAMCTVSTVGRASASRAGRRRQAGRLYVQAMLGIEVYTNNVFHALHTDPHGEHRG
jgi:hypothetical protein